MRDLRQGKKLVNDQSLQLCTIRHRDVDEVVLISTHVVERKSLRQREGFVHEVVGGISCVRPIWIPSNACSSLPSRLGSTWTRVATMVPLRRIRLIRSRHVLGATPTLAAMSLFGMVAS